MLKYDKHGVKYTWNWAASQMVDENVRDADKSVHMPAWLGAMKDAYFTLKQTCVIE